MTFPNTLGSFIFKMIILRSWMTLWLMSTTQVILWGRYV